MPKLSNMASYAMVMGVIGVMGYVHGIYNQLNQLPMTDPWCWYINANIKGVFVDGIHGTSLIYQHHGSVMGYDPYHDISQGGAP